jgi:glycine/D-amino acid oxidase-like deaminating enzyme
MVEFVNGGVSFWWRQLGLPERRAPLPGDLEVDVAIIGAGYTGLWTAYYLALADPSLRIALLEREFAGFGASGRNGGWLTGELAGSPAQYAKAHGRQAVVALQHEMYASVDAVLTACAAEGLDIEAVKSGVLRVARSTPQRTRLLAEVEEARKWGVGERDLWLLSPTELGELLQVEGALLASYSPHCARIQPAKLVRGLAASVERLGATIYEDTKVTRMRPGVVRTSRGTVRARYVLRATEGFTSGLRGERRTWLPMNSSLIVTEQLPEEAWKEIGWSGSELLGDAAHAYMYAQRTTDGRIAFGGRGVPYRFASRWDASGRTSPDTVASLAALLGEFFPATRGVAIEHAWSGVLGVPRDWCSSVSFDPSTGLGWAGGYVGNGVATANLAGRTLTDLVLRRDSPLVRLPWVGHTSPRWEPEPVRYVGVHAMYAAYRYADRQEDAGLAHTARAAEIADVMSGRR